ncbi:GxxExxY protein [Candidatus Omnitrophota bacterium]
MKGLKTNHREHGVINNFSLCSPKKYPLKEVTEKIISCCIEVHSNLGPGLLENIYEEAKEGIKRLIL